MRVALIIVALAATVSAQNVVRRFSVLGGVSGTQTFEFVNAEFSFDTKVVKGAPYSAEATTETSQTLSDGNRIFRRTQALVYRDSEGRTRREQTLGPAETIFINDPVAGVNYVMDRNSKIARKSSTKDWYRVQMLKDVARIKADSDAGGVTSIKEITKEPKAESLGMQMIEGVSAEGTRTVVAIAAGEIGNERPIEIVTERWYSAQLQTVVMNRRVDPFAGETVYKLTNLKLGEPEQSLFEVPSDYTVRDAPAVYEFHTRTQGEAK